jgi:DeoR/GlpR family transcriptional regulator of sugar metabolism
VLHASGRMDTTVVLVGGVRTPSDALVGPVAISTLRTLHVETLFLGVHGMHESAGFTTPNLLESQTNEAFLHAAQRCVVVADHTKWGVQGLATIAPLRSAATIITDEALPPDAQKTLREHTELVLVTTRRP